MKTINFLVVGAGFSGSVVAERLASAGQQVLVIDKRLHHAGNAYDEYDSHGVLIHRYGPHIFHTQSKQVFYYLSIFTKWRPYEHKVKAMVEGKLFPIPINQTTINKLYSLNLDEIGIQKFLNKTKENINKIKTSEDIVLSTVGRDLYEKFFKNYTIKQWGLSPSELSSSVTSRIPVRSNTDDRYFTDKYQAMPLKGYSKLFENLLDHKNIRFEAGINFFEIKKQSKAKHIIFTGPIDEFYDYCYGKLPYRSLFFEHLHFPNFDKYQPVAVINYPNDYDFTRITEFKHMTGQKIPGTSIVKEFPQAEGEPYYPIPRLENDIIYKKYEALARNERNVSFLGRLAQYRYYNMDQVVEAALKLANKLLSKNND